MPYCSTQALTDGMDASGSAWYWDEAQDLHLVSKDANTLSDGLSNQIKLTCVGAEDRIGIRICR